MIDDGTIPGVYLEALSHYPWVEVSPNVFENASGSNPDRDALSDALSVRSFHDHSDKPEEA